MKRRHQSSLLGMRIPHRLRCSPGGESASSDVLLRDLDRFLPSTRILDPLALRAWEHPYRAQEFRSHREYQEWFFHGDDSDHR